MSLSLSLSLSCDMEDLKQNNDWEWSRELLSKEQKELRGKRQGRGPPTTCGFPQLSSEMILPNVPQKGTPSSILHILFSGSSPLPNRNPIELINTFLLKSDLH